MTYSHCIGHALFNYMHTDKVLTLVFLALSRASFSLSSLAISSLPLSEATSSSVFPNYTHIHTTIT